MLDMIYILKVFVILLQVVSILEGFKFFLRSLRKIFREDLEEFRRSLARGKHLRRLHLSGDLYRRCFGKNWRHLFGCYYNHIGGWFILLLWVERKAFFTQQRVGGCTTSIFRRILSRLSTWCGDDLRHGLHLGPTQCLYILLFIFLLSL